VYGGLSVWWHLSVYSWPAVSQHCWKRWTSICCADLHSTQIGWGLKFLQQDCVKQIWNSSRHLGKVSLHGLINYKDTKTQCRHLKRFTWKGTLQQVFIRVYRLTGIFDPALWIIAPLTFSLVHLPPSLFQSTVYTRTYSVWLGGGGGIVLEIIFCRSLTLCIWPDSEFTKLLDHSKQK
jgi:hypothetical protein